MSNPDSVNRTPAQLAQVEEARNRAAPRDDAGREVADPVQTAIDDNTGEPAFDGEPAVRPIEREDKPARKPLYMSPQDEARAAIAKRFKRDDEGEVPFNGNASDPEMLYGKFGREDLGEQPDPQPEAAAPAPAEKKFTIKVRGREVTLTEAELLERASKVEAADTYLAESRDLLEQARDVRRSNNAERTGEEPHRPEARTSTQNDELDHSQQQQGQHPDPLVSAIEEIQFGDPKEAAGKIREVITKAADDSADQRQLTRLIQKDAVTSTNAVKAFMDQNPHLNDPDTERWMESKIYDLQRAEIAKLGVVAADKIPTDTRTLAKWHQFYRVHGANVSDQATMLETAKARLDAWRGTPSKPDQREQPRRESPRVEVNVDRQARRMAIPNQPSRPSAPRPDSAPSKPQGSNRSSVIQGMRAARGQLVG
jgi:hypothetical protein